MQSGETVENELQRMILNIWIEKSFVKLLQNFSSFFNFLGILQSSFKVSQKIKIKSIPCKKNDYKLKIQEK
jgi:hypothetical protein